MKKILIILLASGLSFSAFSAENFKTEIKDGKVEFLAQGPLVKVKGKGEGVKGEIQISDALKASGEFLFNLKSLKTGISLRDDHMKNKYLHVDKYPVAKVTFKDITVPADYKGRFKFKGELSLHNKTKEVFGFIKLKGKKKNLVKFEAEMKLKFADFDIPVPSFKLVSVGEEMSVKIISKAKSAMLKQVVAGQAK